MGFFGTDRENFWVFQKWARSVSDGTVSLTGVSFRLHFKKRLGNNKERR